MWQPRVQMQPVQLYMRAAVFSELCPCLLVLCTWHKAALAMKEWALLMRHAELC